MGRDAEIATVTALLDAGETRVLTLTGPGGVGKTRLAIEVARGLERDFAGGSCLVPLASIRDPDMVLPALAGNVGVQPTGDRPLVDTLVDRLRDDHLLIVLDNFEHLLATTPAWLVHLLEHCRRLNVLITSRRPLRISGERRYQVAPLTVPDGESLTVEDAAAVRLFVQRAQAIRPEFAITETNREQVAEICRGLDGLPLAIELASARVNVLTPAQILARMSRRFSLLYGGPGDVSTRHQSMHEAIAWSHELLSPDEKRLFRHLAVFVGGFTLDAASAVGDSPRLGVVEGVASLVDNSLVVMNTDANGDSRFHLLETIREFGLEQLAAHDEVDAARDAHATWYLAQAEAWRAAHYTALEPASLDGMESDRFNLGLALGWFEAGGQTGAEPGLRLVAALAWFWHTRGPAQEGVAWAERLLKCRMGVAPAVRADALTGAALLNWTVGGFECAADLLNEALALWRVLGDRPGLVRALNFAALVADARRDPAGEVAANEEAVAIARAVGDPVWVALSVGSFGHMLARRGEAARAEAAFAEDLSLLRAAGYERGMGWALEGLANSAMAARDGERAQGYYREALALACKHRSLTTVAIEMRKLAAAVALGGRAADATRLLAAAVALRVANGASTAHEEAFDVDQLAGSLRAALGNDAYQRAWHAGQLMNLDQLEAEVDLLLAGKADSPSQGPSVSLAVDRLTRRELEVLCLMAHGLTNQQIADRLFNSKNTISNHVSHILDKLHVETRTAAVSIAIRERLV